MQQTQQPYAIIIAHSYEMQATYTEKSENDAKRKLASLCYILHYRYLTHPPNRKLMHLFTLHNKAPWGIVNTKPWSSSRTCSIATPIQNAECRDAAEKAVLIDTNINLTHHVLRLAYMHAHPFAAGLQRRPQILDKVQNTSWNKHDITLESVVFLSTKAEHKELYEISIDKMIRTQ